MRELMRRLEKLEQQITASECTCGESIRVVYPGDALPDRTEWTCPTHGLQRVLQVEYVTPIRSLDS